MPTTSPRRPTLVVGGGLAGLIATWELARAGAAVTLVDAGSKLGGRASTRDRNGFRFNLGPRGLYARGELHRWLASAGIAWTGARPATRHAHLLLDGALSPMPATPWQLAKHPALDLRAKAQLMRFLARLPRRRPGELAGRRFGEVLEAELPRRPARLLVAALARLASYFGSPELLAADAALRQLQRALGGSVYYLDGGWQTLADGIADGARRLGASLVQGKVVELSGGDAGVAGAVLQDGRRLEADAVVLAVPLAAAARLAPPRLLAALDAARASGSAARAACLDVGLSRWPRPDRSFVLGLDQPYYLSVHSATAALAPSGRALIHTMLYHRPDTATTRDQSRQQLEALLDLDQPGWRELALERQFLGGPTVVDLAPTLDADGRDPRPEVETGVDGLFLAGDWVRCGAMLADAAATTGQAAARAALDLPRRAERAA